MSLIHLSQLLRARVVAPSGEAVGRVDDIIVRLRGADTYPHVTGIVAAVGGRRVFVGSGSIRRFTPDRVPWSATRLTYDGSSGGSVRCCCDPMYSDIG